MLRLREAGQLTAAIDLLRCHLAEHPHDSRAAGLLAETLYWTGNVDAALRTYEEAQQRHPADASLRLQHARMLVELYDTAGARALLLTLRELEDTAGEAEALLGTLAHWQGDLASAHQHFETALRLRPGHPAAQRGLSQIREATAPWLRTGFRSFEDDQPLSRMTIVGSAGVHLGPLHSLQMEGEAERFTGEGAAGSTAGSAAIRSYWPRLRLQTELGGGLRWGAAAGRAEWTGRGIVGVRVTRHLVASTTIEREPYLRTLASLTQPVTTESARGRLDWEPSSGWMGQVSFSRIWYPDANVGHSGYGWILAPIIRGQSTQVRGGYVYAWEDTRQSRFTPDLPSSSPPVIHPAPPGRARGNPRGGPRRQEPWTEVTLTGSYVPYYTPIGLRAHSVTASAMLQAGRRITLRLSGAHGVHAREDAPVFYHSPDAESTIRSEVQRRAYTPWNARGLLTAMLADRAHLEIEFDHTRTAYWRGTHLRAGLLYRFLPSARR